MRCRQTGRNLKRNETGVEECLNSTTVLRPAVALSAKNVRAVETALQKIMSAIQSGQKEMVCRNACCRLLLISTVALGLFASGSSIANANEPERMILPAVANNDLPAARALMARIVALSPRVRADEAARVTASVYNAAGQLRRDYQVVWPPLFNNLLINSGIRKRGLCFQWAEDLLAMLDALKLTSLELRWGEGYAGTWQESNCVVVTAKGQPFNTGIILDCWRHSGHLYWTAVASDKVPWVENKAYARFVRTKSVSRALGANRRRDNARS